MRVLSKIAIATAAVATVTIGAAWAHPGHGAHAGFAAGLAHPLSGLDHFIAAFAIGVWALRGGERLRFALPAAFLGAGALGGLAAIMAVSAPLIEPAIVVSTLALVAFAAFGAKTPRIAAMTLAAAFAAPHGFAHFAEAGAATDFALFGAGLFVSTAAIIAVGAGAAAVFFRGGVISRAA